MPADLSLYIHIPFCQRKCFYCDFNTYAGREQDYSLFAVRLAQDIARTGSDLGRPVIQTLFVGGGTPTVLAESQLALIFDGVDQGFRLAPGAEISSEANPGTVDQSRFETLRRLGVNRLSMGVQSFDPEELRFLGRIHDARDAERAMVQARAAGFENINLDFIFGLPGQTVAVFADTLARAVALEPEHLSLYSLTVEPGTPLAAWVANGQVSEPNPDLAADQYDLACDLLADAGYNQYEISNWARGPIQQDGLPRYACRHNLVYWRNQSYLGFGPGAHSSLHGKRWSVVKGVGAYIRAVAESASLIDYEETIPQDLAMGETMMLGLRLVEVGVSRRSFRERFGSEVSDVFGPQLEALQRRGLLLFDDERIWLAPDAKLLGNEVFAAFLPDPD